MLLRVLYFLALACLFVLVLNRLLSWLNRNRGPDSRGAAEQMVLDPQCQSYVPKNEAISRGDYYFCSEECARLFFSR